VLQLVLRLGELNYQFVGPKVHPAAFFMHLLYLDDAGSAGNKSEEYLVVGGVSVYEAQELLPALYINSRFQLIQWNSLLKSCVIDLIDI
jgi:hypothetical protein